MRKWFYNRWSIERIEKSMRKWFYSKWSIERIEKKCNKGFYAVIESGHLVGFKREEKWC